MQCLELSMVADGGNELETSDAKGFFPLVLEGGSAVAGGCTELIPLKTIFQATDTRPNHVALPCGSRRSRRSRRPCQETLDARGTAALASAAAWVQSFHVRLATGPSRQEIDRLI